MTQTVYAPPQKATGYAAIALGFATCVWLLDWVVTWLTGVPHLYCAGAAVWAQIGLANLASTILIGAVVWWMFSRNHRLLGPAVLVCFLVGMLPVLGTGMFSHSRSCQPNYAQNRAAPITPRSAPAISPPAPVSPVVQQQSAAAAAKYGLGPYGLPLHADLGPINPDDSLYIKNAAYQLQIPVAVLHAWMKEKRISFTYPPGYNTNEFDDFTDRTFHISGMEMLRFMRKYCNEPDAPPLWRCHSLTEEIPPLAAPSPAKTVGSTGQPAAGGPAKPAKKWEAIDGTNPYASDQAARLLRMKEKTMLAFMRRGKVPFKDLAGFDTKPETGFIMGDDLEDFETKYCKPLPTYGQSRCKALRPDAP